MCYNKNNATVACGTGSPDPAENGKAAGETLQDENCEEKLREKRCGRKLQEESEMAVSRIIVWGCGGVYNAHLFRLKQMEERGEIKVVGVYSRDFRYGRSLDGYPILKKEEIARTGHDFLLVMVWGGGQEIIREYLEAGGSRDKVLPYRVLDIPDLTFPQYLEIRNARFTVLSEQCYAGTLYRYLGLEALTPLKNMWVSTEDYFRILGDPRGYFSESPVFWKSSEDYDPGYESPAFPILKLKGDVLLYCNHDTDPEQAIEAWNRRRKRVNYDNILVTYYAKNRREEEAFYRQPRYAGRRCFTPYPSDLPDSVFIPDEGGALPITELLAIAMGTNPLIDVYSFFRGPVKYRRM